MGLEDVPFYRRMLGDLAKGRPDLSYKFKSSSVPLSGDPQPGSPAAAEAAQSQSPPEPINITYTDGTILPGRPTHPFEIRVMLNAAGNPNKIRCYKGLIYDPAASTSSSVKSLIVTNNVVTKRVNLRGGRGNSSGFIEGEQRDFVPTNYDGSGPELHKYIDFLDPVQTTWLPHYRYRDTDGGGPSNKSAGRDSDPVMLNVTTPTKSAPIGKDSFTGGSNNDAYFEWPYSDDSYIKLYCYDDGDPENRKWALYLNGALTDAQLGQNGFQIFIGSVDGTQVTQHFKSDIVVPNAGPSSPIHPFKVRPNMKTDNMDTTVWEVYPGTVNNIEMIGGLNDGEPFAPGTFLLSDGDMVWLACKYDSATKKFPSQVQLQYGSIFPEDSKEYGYIKLAKRQGDTLVQFITGSLWGDRIQLGAGESEKALYYYAQV